MLEALIASLNFIYVAKFVPQSQSRNKKDKDKNPTLNWEVSIMRNRGGVFLTSDYSQGIAHHPHWKTHQRRTIYNDAIVAKSAETGTYHVNPDASYSKQVKLPEPKLADVLYSFVSDSDVLSFESFEDWAESYGYDSDSRSAEKIYQECLKNSLKLQAMLGYENLQKLREVFQDY